MTRQGSEAARKIGAKLRRLRDAAGLTQNELANRAGVDPSGLQSYETGRTLPAVGSLVRLARSLGVNPAALVEDLEIEDLPEQRPSADGRRTAARLRRAS